ncbi:MAG: hypothetical protein ACRCSF_12540 [Mycobacteriaceae bacterium]
MQAHTERWAKTQTTPRTAELDAQTQQDRQLYLLSAMVPIQCRYCPTVVLVKKTSRKHTSVQWTSSPLNTCRELSTPEDLDGIHQLQASCTKLEASINYAAAEGILEIPETLAINAEGQHE